MSQKHHRQMQPHLKKEQQMMLWNLHRIVVDVVRTDSHLEVYKDTRNLATMSDILAVYAWVDPATGYCQVMIDLLSPFVILFEDNAEAFWCFEMLIRRLRENFQMEGPSRVMRQLQALWHISKHTDREMFAHLSNIGAESLHFAFPMLLVLFRVFDECYLLMRLFVRGSMISTGNGDDEPPVFCVAAVLIMNHHKIVKETHSIDDVINASADFFSLSFSVFTSGHTGKEKKPVKQDV
ncbi:hypothetical protein SLE2022_094820 [Rubroshorea leprosula]